MSAQPRFRVGDRVRVAGGSEVEIIAVEPRPGDKWIFRVKYPSGDMWWEFDGLLDPIPVPDPVNHPPHYTQGGIECIDAVRAAMGLDGFVAHCRATALKYIWRAGLKGPAAEDIDKAIWYLKRARAEMEGA